MQTSLPKKMRPRNVSYKRFVPGLDLPSWFHEGLKSIDKDFYLVFHPYEVMWDNIINEYEGSLEDPRFTVHREYGELVFGFVLTNGKGFPTPDNSWHLWRYCDPHGWAHILNLESKEEGYLRLVLRRLSLQAKFTDRYGFKAWSRKLEDDSKKENKRQAQEKEELFQAIQDENKWLVKKAAENFERGITKPTNPQKETIFSAPGVSNRTKTVRPLDEKEGGLILPD